MKKRYRVTTRGKIVFPLAALLLIYGLNLMIAPPPLSQVSDVEPTVIEKDNAQGDSDDVTSAEATEVVAEVTEVVAEVTDLEENTKVDNCTTNTYNDDVSIRRLKLLEEAGFTVYYKPNALYVPDGELAKLIEFAKIAKEFPDEDIVIEGNAHYGIGKESLWDNEDAEKLGYKRGLVIKNDLIKRGIDKDRIVIYNNKNTKGLNVDLSVESIALNRRVDVFFSQFMYKEIDTK